MASGDHRAAPPGGPCGRRPRGRATRRARASRPRDERGRRAAAADEGRRARLPALPGAVAATALRHRPAGAPGRPRRGRRDNARGRISTRDANVWRPRDAPGQLRDEGPVRHVSRLRRALEDCDPPALCEPAPDRLASDPRRRGASAWPLGSRAGRPRRASAGLHPSRGASRRERAVALALRHPSDRERPGPTGVRAPHGAGDRDRDEGDLRERTGPGAGSRNRPFAGSTCPTCQSSVVRDPSNTAQSRRFARREARSSRRWRPPVPPSSAGFDQRTRPRCLSAPTTTRSAGPVPRKRRRSRASLAGSR